MEKRRNRPPKYDREQMATTIKAMKRVAEIKKKRDEDFHSARLVLVWDGLGGVVVLKLAVTKFILLLTIASFFYFFFIKF